MFTHKNKTRIQKFKAPTDHAAFACTRSGSTRSVSGVAGACCRVRTPAKSSSVRDAAYDSDGRMPPLAGVLAGSPLACLSWEKKKGKRERV